MKRGVKRTDRLNRELLRVLARLISTELRDPRVHDVVVMSVKVSADLSVANVYVDTLSGDPDEVLKGLEAAQGYLRTLVGAAMRIKRVPRLRFFRDQTVEVLERLSVAVSGEDGDS